MPRLQGNATKSQLRFIDNLLAEVDLLPVQAADAADQLERGLTKQKAHDWIERLKSLKNEQRRTRRSPIQIPDGIPSGHYAVIGEDGTTDFYKVNVEKKKLLLQLSDSYRYIAPASAPLILAKILANPEKAMRRYGRELGVCGSCHRTLTNEVSRRLGIGPVCRRGLGWN